MPLIATTVFNHKELKEHKEKQHSYFDGIFRQLRFGVENFQDS